MDLIKKFNVRVVFLDTAPLIYYIEENPKYGDDLAGIFSANEQGHFRFITSVIT